jgi:hypothetical protein
LKSGDYKAFQREQIGFLNAGFRVLVSMEALRIPQQQNGSADRVALIAWSE